MRLTVVILAFGLCVISGLAHGRAYVPLGEIGNEAAIKTDGFISAKAQDRPFLLGARPSEVELMEDALRRKNPRAIGSSRIAAHESIIRNFLRDPVKTLACERNARRSALFTTESSMGLREITECFAARSLYVEAW